jgi:hypothetical protein
MAYNGRRGPNVSAYIANLNAVPTEQDLQSSNQDSFIDDDLAMFTNTQFFDFDIGGDADLQAGGFAEGPSGQHGSPDDVEAKGLDFMPGQFRSVLHLLCCFVPAFSLHFSVNHSARAVVEQMSLSQRTPLLQR